MESFDSFCGGAGFFGPTATREDGSLDPNWDPVDFSTCFETLVLTSIPAAFILLAGLGRVLYLINARPRSLPFWNSSWQYAAKQVLGAAVCILLATDILRAHWDSRRDVEFVSPAIMILGTILAMFVLHMEHIKGSRSSGVATLFWLLTVAADAVKLRTYVLRYERHYEDNFAFGIFLGHMTLSLISLGISSFLEPALYAPLEGDLPSCPEMQSPLFSRLTFWWMSPIMALGYSRPLVQEDLWNINQEDESRLLSRAFTAEWAKESAKSRETKSMDAASLASALARAFGTPFYIAGIFKLGNDMLNFVGPLLLAQLINYVNSDDPTWHGYLLAGALFASAELQSILLHQYFHRVMALGMRLRSAVIGAVYNKALVLTVSAKQSTTTGEMVNLMAVDAQRFMDLTSYLHMLWSAPIQIGLSLYFLWDLLDYAVLGGLGVMILTVPLNGFIARKTRAQQVLQMVQKDQRIKLMNEVLNGVKVIKLYAWESPYERFIDRVREAELKVLKATAYLNAVAMFFWSCAPFFVSLVTFIIYSLAIGSLTAEKAFVSLSLFNILRFPMSMLPMLISSLVEAQVSVKRLKKFLLQPEMRPDAITRTNASGLGGQGSKVPVVKVDHGTFAWSIDAAPTLMDVELSVLPGTLAAVVGQVGSGKSSLLSAMLGDMEKLDGRVTIPVSLAYVPQQAWIQNATVRDNILFGRAYNEQRYLQVIRACALEADLQMLPAGDATEIGEKGINLSGGQKQRVSLARAVYQDSDCYFLDDPLSAVDAHVGKHIFEHVIGPQGLLQNKTRILVTHGINFLPQTDQVVVLREGRVTESGSYTHLLAQNGVFAHFIAEHSQEEEKHSEEASADDDSEPAAAAAAAAEAEGGVVVAGVTTGSSSTDPVSAATTAASTPALSRSTSKEAGARSGSGAGAPALSRTTSKDDRTKDVAARAATGSLGEEKKGAKLIMKEAVGEGDVKRQVYLSYFRANGYGICILILVLYLAAYGLQIGSNVWLSMWSSDKHADSKLGMYLGGYAGLGIGNAIGILVVTLISSASAVSASRSMHSSMLKAVLRSPMSFFDTTPLGRIVNRFSKDMYAVDETIPRSLRSFLTTFLQVVSIIAVISYSTPIFMAAILPLGLLYYWIQRYYVATSRQLQRLESVTRSPIYALFSETLNGVSSIRAYGRQRQFIDLNEQRLDTNMRAYYPNICANRWLALRLEFLGNCIIFFAALFAVVERKSISPEVVGLSLSYAMSVTQTLNWMVRMSSQLESDIVAVERVEEYISLPSEAPLILAHRPQQAWPPEGQITIDQLCLRYRPELDLVLRGLSCHIRGGEKVGIVGRTGAGKSSLTLSLFRLIEPSSGRIIIDGENITQMGLQDVRSRLTVMPQDPVLFCGTVRDNLDPFHDFDDAHIWSALETCSLRDFVTSLGGGLEGRVAEGGENFSVGQRQLLCLARAVLRRTKVLVLDEATAAVDLETDQLIQRTIRTVFRACTVLTIAHRINTIMDSDRVMVLDKGTIVEFDSPANLLAMPSGIFRGMAAAAGIAAART